MGGPLSCRGAAATALIFCLILPTSADANAGGGQPLPVDLTSWATDYRLASWDEAPRAAVVADHDPAEAAGRAMSSDGAAWSAPREPDRAGLRRDTTYLLSYHVAAIGILFMLPENVSGWSDEQKEEYTLSKWWHNASNPRWDDDKFWINYLTHPYWGAAYYVRARERGYDERASFWYSAAMSTAYEFGAEALFERPSLQDLVVTPVGGVILGEYFMDLRARTAARYAPGEDMHFRDRALLALTDPLGAINRQVQSWLGVKVQSSFYPYFGPQRLGAPAAYAEDRVETHWVYGLRMNYRW